MSKRKIVLLIIALLIGGTTVLLARAMLSGAPQNAGQPQQQAQTTHEVLVAARDIPSGTILKDADMKWQAWPIESGGDRYAVKGKSNAGDYVGAVVRSGLHEGDPLPVAHLVKPGQQGFMAAALMPNMRAVSIALTPVAGVAGFVFPGDRVDVIVTHQVGRKNETEGPARKVSETILHDVRVLALDQKMSDQMTEPKIAQIATLEVTGRQAEAVALGSEIGTLALALRSVASDPQAEAPTTTTAAGEETATPDKNADLAIDAAALALPGAARAVTWDSDVSKVLPRPANRIGAVQKITIIRGKESSEAVYDLTNP